MPLSDNLWLTPLCTITKADKTLINIIILCRFWVVINFENTINGTTATDPNSGTNFTMLPLQPFKMAETAITTNKNINKNICGEPAFFLENKKGITVRISV
ncbi:MAG: hypothetical protein ABL903_12925 [Methylococcales bacterium]